MNIRIQLGNDFKYTVDHVHLHQPRTEVTVVYSYSREIERKSVLKSK